MTKDDRFAELERDYYNRVVAFFVRSGCTKDEALDLAQETFLRVYNGMDGFLGKSTAKTWVLTIARNVLLNERRYWRPRGGWHRTRSLTDLESPDNEERSRLELVAPDASPLERAEQEERLRQLWSAIDELPTEQRRCVRLWVIGHKYREIATMTGKSIETVKSLLHEGKEKLRLRLTGDASALDELDEETEP